MKCVRIMLITVAVLICPAEKVEAQDGNESRANIIVQPSINRPELRADLSTHAKVKVFLARNRYRFGELVKVDVGLRLKNTSPHYFTPDFSYRIIIKDSRGSPITIKTIANIDARPRYQKVANTLLIHSTYLIVGCTTPMLLNFEKSIDAGEWDDPDWLFENNVFGSPADGCIDLPETGFVEVNVEVFNELVVIPEIGDDTKTLVGLTRRGPSLRVFMKR